MHNIHRWYFEIPLEDVQAIVLANGAGTVDKCCFLCGKRIKKVIHFVHITTSGNLISIVDDTDESQGFFPIGSECKGKVPNNFIFADPGIPKKTV